MLEKWEACHLAIRRSLYHMYNNMTTSPCDQKIPLSYVQHYDNFTLRSEVFFLLTYIVYTNIRPFTSLLTLLLTYIVYTNIRPFTSLLTLLLTYIKIRQLHLEKLTHNLAIGLEHSYVLIPVLIQI